MFSEQCNDCVHNITFLIESCDVSLKQGRNQVCNLSILFNISFGARVCTMDNVSSSEISRARNRYCAEAVCQALEYMIQHTVHVGCMLLLV